MHDLINFEYKHIIFTGDINIDMLDLKTAIGKQLLQIVTANGYKTLVDFPTRITESTETATDNIYLQIWMVNFIK